MNTDSENPYLNARRTWNTHTGSLVAAGRMWQIVGIAGLLIGLAAVGGVIHLSSQSKYIPFVVEVNKLGEPLAISQAQLLTPVDPRVIQQELGAFISQARRVTPDFTLERDGIFRVYAMIGAHDPSLLKMNEWMNGSPDANPFKRAEKFMVSTDISSVIQQNADTWQVDWTETTRTRDGALVGTVPYRGLLTVYVEPPTSATTEQQFRRNPLGIYVRDFSWSKQM